ncbi:MAG: hypothetical protein JRI34_03310 [Deltaproteobacteria bacterium]|nr:hypothetical protein [Deltaproteobacteria bacterium]
MVDEAEPDEMSLKVLASLFIKAQSSPDGAVNMWTLGQNMGLDRPRMEDLAMELVANGFLEIKSLDGKVILTEAGLEKAQALEPGLAMRDTPDTLESFIDELTAFLEQLNIDSQARKNLGIDLTTLRGQLARSPKLMPVINATLEAIKEILIVVPDDDTASLLNTLTNLRTDIE